MQTQPLFHDPSPSFPLKTDLNSLVSAPKQQLNPENLLSRVRESNQPKVGFYSIFLIGLLCAIRSIYTLQNNSIGYAYGFEGVGSLANDPRFMLSAAFPGLAPVYAIVASFSFSVAYSFSNILMSSQSRNWDKKKMLASALMCMGLTAFLSGSTHSLLVFAAMRFAYGVCASAINVPIYQIIANTIPEKFRSTAIAVENSGYYLGSGLASSMVLIIKQFGWRAMYGVIGATCSIASLCVLLFIRQAPREKNDSKDDPKEFDQPQNLRTVT